MQQNSIKSTCMAPDRCPLIEYSRLPDGTYNDQPLTEMSTSDISWRLKAASVQGWQP